MTAPLPPELVIEGKSRGGVGVLCASCKRRVDEHFQHARDKPGPILRSAPALPAANGGRKQPVGRRSEIEGLSDTSVSIPSGSKRASLPSSHAPGVASSSASCSTDTRLPPTDTDARPPKQPKRTEQPPPPAELPPMQPGKQQPPPQPSASAEDSARSEKLPAAAASALGSSSARCPQPTPAAQPPKQPTTIQQRQPEKPSKRPSHLLALATLPERSARSKKPFAAMSKEELLPIVRAEKDRGEMAEKLLRSVRSLAEKVLKELEVARKDSIRLQATQALLKEHMRPAADRKRHDLLDAARSELIAGGRRDFLEGFATAVTTGKLPPNCIYARRLSDASRNVNVAMGQRRYSRPVLAHLAYASQQRGRKAFETMSSESSNPQQRGEPMPSAKTVQRFFKQQAGTRPGEPVRMGYLEQGVREFGNHLQRVEAILRNAEHELSPDAPALDEPSSGLPRVPYRVACDAESVEPELHVCLRTGAYTGDEDLSQVRTLTTSRRPPFSPSDDTHRISPRTDRLRPRP